MENITLLHVDDLGRIAIPKEIRKMIGIREGESLELFVTDQNSIIFRKAGTTEMKPCPIVEPKKIIYTFENPYDNNYRVVSITPEQDKLLDWLCNNGYINDDVNIEKGYPNCDDLTK